MLLSKLKSLKWQYYQMSKVGGDTGVITMTATPPVNKKDEVVEPLYIEIGWFLKKAINEKPRLILNPKHEISCNFLVEKDPKDPITLPELADSLPWRDVVMKALPEDTFI